MNSKNSDPNGRTKKVQVYLKTPREQEIFSRIKEALGEDETGTFTYIMKWYAEEHNLIAEHLHQS